jgi:hypothetical protein
MVATARIDTPVPCWNCGTGVKPHGIFWGTAKYHCKPCDVKWVVMGKDAK